MTPDRTSAREQQAGAADDFGNRLLAWHRHAGRHDLPWQLERTPYRVWLSEIMLQQTQVGTVIPYFRKFVATFPDVGALARASVDEVLHLWSGLGYYSRARNLHRAARLVMEQHEGTLPDSPDGLLALPGIGRSTAGAILALAHDRPHAILDGNVKRVLARFHAVEGWPGESGVLKTLWALSEASLPASNARDYTQAVMDLGATVCTRGKPACDACPLREDCAARRLGRTTDFPAPRPRRNLPLRRTCFVVIEDGDGAVLLERRPPSGIWGGLWCFPEVGNEADAGARVAELGLQAMHPPRSLDTFTHTFTHFRLEIRPLRFDARANAVNVRDGEDLCWYSGDDSIRIGVSAPVSRILNTLR